MLEINILVTPTTIIDHSCFLVHYRKGAITACSNDCVEYSCEETTIETQPALASTARFNETTLCCYLQHIPASLFLTSFLDRRTGGDMAILWCTDQPKGGPGCGKILRHQQAKPLGVNIDQMHMLLRMFCHTVGAHNLGVVVRESKIDGWVPLFLFMAAPSLDSIQFQPSCIPEKLTSNEKTHRILSPGTVSSCPRSSRHRNPLLRWEGPPESRGAINSLPKRRNSGLTSPGSMQHSNTTTPGACSKARNS